CSRWCSVHEVCNAVQRLCESCIVAVNFPCHVVLDCKTDGVNSYGRTGNCTSCWKVGDCRLLLGGYDNVAQDDWLSAGGDGLYQLVQTNLCWVGDVLRSRWTNVQKRTDGVEVQRASQELVWSGSAVDLISHFQDSLKEVFCYF